MEICFHEFENQVKILIILSPNNIMQFDEVGVIKFVEEYDLAKSSLGICGMLKSIKNFL